jgi:hypothetical protein
MRLLRRLFHWRARPDSLDRFHRPLPSQLARLQMFPPSPRKKKITICDSWLLFTHSLLRPTARPLPLLVPRSAAACFVPTCREPSSATCSCTVSWHRVLRKESDEPKGVRSLLSVSWVRWGVVKCHLGLEWVEGGKGADLQWVEAAQGNGGSVAFPLADA